MQYPNRKFSRDITLTASVLLASVTCLGADDRDDQASQASEQAVFLSRIRQRIMQPAPAAIACYPSDLTPDQIARIMRENQFLPPGMVGPPDERYWTDSTVWTGEGLQGPSGRAAAASLTYSFAPDAAAWGISDTSITGISNLNATLESVFGASDGDRGLELIRQALANHRKYTGLRYREVADDGSPMDELLPRLQTRGDIRIGGFVFTNSSALAYNALPGPGPNTVASGGDMAINTSSFVPASFTDPANNYRYFRNTIAHEHGHGTGNIHSIPCDNTKLMEPFANTAFDGLQIDDRRGGARNYGDRYAGNNSAANAVGLGDLTSQSFIARDLSTNGVSGPNGTNQDWYRFALRSPQPVVITVTPTGGTYTAGQQGNSCSGFEFPIPASAAGNLNISLRDSTGATNLFPLQGSSAPAGVAENISVSNLAAGTYTIQVIDIGPNPASGQTVQMYDITVRTGSSKAPPQAVAGIHKRAQANTNCWFMGDINSEVTEVGASISTAGYDWDSDGDGTFDTLDQPQFSRTFPSNGVYPVTLRLTDSNNRSSTDTINVTVFGAAAALTAVAPGAGDRGTTVPVTISGVNLKGITSASQVTVSGSGVGVIGTPTPNALGTQVTGISFQISAGAAGGPRDVSVTNSDASGTASGDATIVGAFVVNAPPPVCPGDLNNDGARNTADLTTFLSAFGTSVPPGTSGDLNGDGGVNTSDLTMFLAVFGVPC